MVLDLAASALALGHSTYRLGRTAEDGAKRGPSQVFVAVDVRSSVHGFISEAIEETAQFLLERDGGRGLGHLPGRSRIEARKANLRIGIEVNDSVWEQILKLRR